MKVLVSAHELVFPSGDHGPRLDAIVGAMADECHRQGVAVVGGWLVEIDREDRLAFCQNCRRPFVPAHGKQRYCRTACRQTAAYRRRIGRERP